MPHLALAAALALSAGPAPPAQLRPVNATDWTRECLQAFQIGGGFASPAGNVDIDISGYDLMGMPHGLCTEWLACSLENCELDAKRIAALGGFKVASDPLSVLTDAGVVFNLPDFTALPRGVGDVVAVMKYASAIKKPVSVKSTGHSYAGSSTQRGSVQLNMRDFPKYSQVPMWNTLLTGTWDGPVYTAGPLPSVIYCAMLAPEMLTQACKVAAARGKPATLRVGGGERWDDAFRAVENANYYTKKFFNATVEVVGGAAGSVGAAGGWVQGSGLSYGAERRWGFGADHVLEVEMVLADGTHVKFGPSAWEHAEGYAYPRTTAVAGFCNAKPEAEEGAWVWKACPEGHAIPFMDLWHAVRGGGGGTYGVVTAMTYQLHPARTMQILYGNAQIFGYVATVCPASAAPSAACAEVQAAFLDFFVDVLFNPSNVGLDELTSVNCGHPSIKLDFASLAASMASGGFLFCHDGAAEKVIAAYAAYVNKTALSPTAQQLLAPVLPYWATPFTSAPFRSYVAAVIGGPAMAAGFVPAPVGHMYDSPHPEVDSQARGCWSALVPVEVLRQKSDFVHLVMSVGDAHVIGGRANTSHDQTTAIPAAQRSAGLQKHICGDDVIARALKLFQPHYPPAPKAGVAGGAEINHIAPDGFGPLRNDTAAPCPSSFTHAEREAQCLSYQEFVWGTDGLARLAKIKNTVDPDNVFNCQKCVGYDPAR